MGQVASGFHASPAWKCQESLPNEPGHSISSWHPNSASAYSLRVRLSPPSTEARGLKRSRNEAEVETFLKDAEPESESKRARPGVPALHWVDGKPHFHGYNIIHIPGDAFPTQGKLYFGRHGYTVTSPTNNAAPRFRLERG